MFDNMNDYNIDEQLAKIESIIMNPSFLKNRGLSNEVGYYIFDYNPKYELKVREKIDFLVNKINSDINYSTKIIKFDLYELLIQILNDEGFLEQTFKFEESKGTNFAINAVSKSLRLTSDNNLIINQILNNVTDDCVVFITGVGKAYPIIRSHNILNNLHLKLDTVPVILFFPGKFSGNNLVLFNTIDAGNYYRAFPLVSGR